MNIKAGNGINDDTEYIQGLLDSGKSCVYLPEPEKFYLISKPLRIPSETALVLDRFTEIRLAPGSNCLMLQNADPVGGNRNISVAGGIWNYNNLNQEPNPLATQKYKANNQFDRTFNDSDTYSEEYLGVPIRFMRVENLHISGLTLKDPITFAVQLGFVKYFTVSDITFDFNLGNPCAANMDGIHIDGGCRFGHVENLKGTCYDDLVAVNADDFISGPISDITINGIYSEECHSAVRLLSVVSPVRNISISNVYGSYYQYAVTLSKYFERPGSRGQFSNIILKNLSVSKSIRRPELKKITQTFELICIEPELDIDSLVIENLSRYETVNPVETIHIAENTSIGLLAVRDSVQKNCLNHPDYVSGKGHIGDTNEIRPYNRDTNDIIFCINDGKIGRLDFSGTQAEGTLLCNNGVIEKIIS